MRLPPIDPTKLDPAQKGVYDRIAGGARGGVRGPFLALLHSPELAGRVEQLGVFVRYECSIPQRLREIAILVVARHWRADYEWYAHAPIAEKLGISGSLIDAFGAGEAVAWPGEDDTLVVALCSTLLAKGRVDDETYAAATERFGQRGVTDLVGLVGYYTLLALTLNAHEVEVPADARLPWQQPSDHAEPTEAGA